MLKKRRFPKGKRRSESILDAFRGQESTRYSEHVVFQRENDVLRAFWTHFAGRNRRDIPKTLFSKGKTTFWKHFDRISAAGSHEMLQKRCFPKRKRRSGSILDGFQGQESTRCSKNVVSQRKNDVLRAFRRISGAGIHTILQKRRCPKRKRCSASILADFNGRNPQDAPKTSFSKVYTTFCLPFFEDFKGRNPRADAGT